MSLRFVPPPKHPNPYNPRARRGWEREDLYNGARVRPVERGRGAGEARTSAMPREHPNPYDPRARRGWERKDLFNGARARPVERGRPGSSPSPNIPTPRDPRSLGGWGREDFCYAAKTDKRHGARVRPVWRTLRSVPPQTSQPPRPKVSERLGTRRRTNVATPKFGRLNGASLARAGVLLDRPDELTPRLFPLRPLPRRSAPDVQKGRPDLV